MSISTLVKELNYVDLENYEFQYPLNNKICCTFRLFRPIKVKYLGENQTFSTPKTLYRKMIFDYNLDGIKHANSYGEI